VKGGWGDKGVRYSAAEVVPDHERWVGGQGRSRGGAERVEGWHLEEVFTGPRCALMRSTARETASAVADADERAATWRERTAKLNAGPARNRAAASPPLGWAGAGTGVGGGVATSPADGWQCLDRTPCIFSDEESQWSNVCPHAAWLTSLRYRDPNRDKTLRLMSLTWCLSVMAALMGIFCLFVMLFFVF